MNNFNVVKAIEKQAVKQTDKQIDKQSESQIVRQVENQADKQPNRQTDRQAYRGRVLAMSVCARIVKPLATLVSLVNRGGAASRSYPSGSGGARVCAV